MSDDVGGDPACWAAQVCPVCGQFMDAGHHDDGCPDQAGDDPSAGSTRG